MPKVSIAALIAAALTTAFLSGSSPVQAQSSRTVGQGQSLLSDSDMQAMVDERIDLVKNALNLTPEQEKLWPAIEQAIRRRAAARHALLKAMAARLADDRERDPIQLAHERADALAQRADSLNRLADAWKPLYETLDPSQKMRFRVLSMYVIREMRNAIDDRRAQFEEEDEE